MKNKCYRYLLLFLGLLCNGFGVAFITKSALGTTPIASIPYTLYLIFPKITLGNFTIMVQIFLILAQVIILRKQSNILNIILQIPITLLFGYVIDFSMKILAFFHPENYSIKFLTLLLGCLIISFGAYFEVVANVTMLPADGFTKAVAVVTKKDFGVIKLLTDSSQAIIALIIGLFCLHNFAGVREGTIIGALLIGNIIKLIGKTWQLERAFSSL